MKKELFNWAIICMVAFVSIGLASCSNDDDSNDNESETIDANAIFGTWQLVLEEGFEDGEYYSTDRYIKDRRRYYHIDKDGTCVEYFIRFADEQPWDITTMNYFALDVENKRIKLQGSEWDELITLTKNTMKVKSVYGPDDEWWELQTFNKVSDSVLDDIK